VQLTVLGCCGAWPTVGAAASGYLLQHSGFRLLLEIGYAVLPRLQAYIDVTDVDAVIVSHGHPDHCVDLNPLLRARVLRDDPPPPLPVFAPSGALDAVLALDRPGMLDDAYTMTEIDDGNSIDVGPFHVETRMLPHWVPNIGLRVIADDASLAYTGDSGPSPAMTALARNADLLLAEASFVEEVPHDSIEHLSSAEHRGRLGTEARVRQLMLTHLLPGTDASASAAAAQRRFRGPVTVARPGEVVDVGGRAPHERESG
jgi:ribonuclease BN (tRNA processing enzyme)